jgi:peptide methionine sulfoxide reductase MsrB
MKISVNKFLLEVEEIKCSSCGTVTGHIFIGNPNSKGKWTCVICGSQLGSVESKSSWKDLWNKLILKLRIK